MKKILFMTLCLLSNVCIGQNDVEVEPYVSNDVIVKNFGLPVVREVYGGTKIVVDFEGNWSYDMKGAFKYACELWEEAMPTTFPIKILAKLDESRTSSSYSTLTIKSIRHDSDSWGGGGEPYTERSTWSQVKGVTFYELTEFGYMDAYSETFTKDLLEEYDIIITYYNKSNKLVDNFSFSLNEDIDSNKYDFVTFVLRDIAKSLGIVWEYRNVRNGKFDIDVNPTIPFASYVLSALQSGGDYYQAYQNALTDSIVINSSNASWALYASPIWDRDKSLNYFRPNNRQKLTQLLSYDFGRGSVIRDFSDNYTYEFFRDILHWKGDIAVGVGGGSSMNETTGSTGNAIAYKGTISIPTSRSANSENMASDIRDVRATNVSKMLKSDVDSLVSVDSLKLYLPSYGFPEGLSTSGWFVSLLLKNGKWDVVYEDHPNIDGLEVSTEDFTYHYNDDEYARTCDGYMRCRITKGGYSFSVQGMAYTSYYYLLNCLPQKVKMKMSRVMPYVDEEDYYRDVKIALEDIEGVTRILVSQLDEGNEFPYQYEVTDFRNGYFIATVDKEFNSTFTVTAYNENGSTRSYSYVVEALEPINELNIDLVIGDDNIEIQSKSRDLSDKQLISSYQINKVSASQIQMMDMEETENTLPNEKNSIDISSLDEGLYTLTVTDIKGGIHSIKFVKD